MAKADGYICDRCGAIMESQLSNPSGYILQRLDDQNRTTVHLDLCRPCRAAFLCFMENERSDND